MKISLAWIADHLALNRKELNANYIVEQLGAITAEIDAVERVSSDLSSLFAAITVEAHENEVLVEVPELKKKYTLAARKDAIAQNIYLIKISENKAQWATLADLGSGKEGLFPNVSIDSSALAGGWKDAFEADDTIITIENKAITNRPDLWGHRGVAREVAAILDTQLTQEESIYVSKPIKHYANQSQPNGTNPFVVEIAPPGTCGQPCNRLACFYIPSIANKPSLLWMAVRLARVDGRPLDMLVDMTNFVMFDIGHPMHAFDAQKIGTKKLLGRCAFDGEKIKLLDGDEVTLTAQDYVISDGEKALAVAGVMGGQSTSVSKDTTSLLLEAAHFEPTPIRRTATRLKKRTESSSRFEKNLDPHQNTQALLRYLKLLEDSGFPPEQESIISLGALAPERVIVVAHELIESKIGVQVAPERVESILKKLGFGITISNKPVLTYTVIVPTYRATKDVTIAEDIVEEVARFIGYKTIEPIVPTRAMTAFDITRIERMRALKLMLGQGLAMHEVQTYAFFDEEFLRQLKYDPTDALRVANPLSEHWQRLITSLIPNLLKCVVTNQGHETVRFFECNRVWFYQEHPVETLECAGILYEMKKEIDFYECKALLMRIFQFFKLDIRWEKASESLDPWYDKNQTAQLWFGDRIIGAAGKIAPLFLQTVAVGDAFIFELDANFLLNAVKKVPAFKPLAKYPATELDISLIVPMACTVNGLETAISSADKRIIYVELIDSFTKPEWTTTKSVTLRFKAQDEAGTLTKEDIDTIWQHVVTKVKAIGAEVR